MACCAEIDLECFGCNMALYDNGIVSTITYAKLYFIGVILAV